MYEDRVDLHTAIDRPEQFPGIAAKITVLSRDYLRLEVVMRMLERERCEFIRRDADRAVAAELFVDGRQKGLRFGDKIAAAAALVALLPVIRHVDERPARHDAVHRNHEQVRAGPFREIDGAVIKQAVQDVEVPHQVALGENSNQALRDDREFNVCHLAQLGENRIAAKSLLAGCIRDDAEDDLPLHGKRRQIVLRQHRSHIVAQEIANVFFTPDDASHRENFAIRVPRAIGLSARFAGGKFDGAIVQEGLYLEAERQIAGPSEVSKFLEQAKSKEIDPDPVEGLVFMDGSRVAGLPFQDLLANGVELSL